MMNLIIPKFGKGESTSIPDYVERQLRNGGLFHEMYRREKATTRTRMERASAGYRNYQRKRGSELNLRAVVDSRTWMRWYLTDPHFWDDPENIRRFVRDNPEAAPWKH
jgi:hypothetical protein